MSNKHYRKPILFYIYEITNNINTKNYVGKRKCPSNKTPETDNYMGSGVLIVKAEKKYGMENFSKRILATCYSEKIENILEKQYIAIYRSIGKAEYNITDGGDGTCGMEAWNKGKHGIYTEEQRKQMSLSHKGKPISKESIEKRKETIKGYVWWTNGIKCTKSLNCPGNGWYLGRTEEYRNKISKSNKGHPATKGSKGMHWYNNGITSVFTYECPEGFISGRI